MLSYKRGLIVPWKGFATIPKVAARLARRSAITLSLPAGFHHAVSVRLCPATCRANLDVTGGVELLEKLAQVAGLREFADLAGPVAAAGARVRIQSPAPQVHLFIPEAAGAAA